MQLRWEGEGVEERGYDAATGNCIVAIDPHYFRPTEVDTLLGDASKARARFGWEAKISFQTLVEEMVAEDLKSAQRDHLLTVAGYQAYQHHE